VVLDALGGGQAMTAGQLAEATGLKRDRIAPELSKLVKAGELVKAPRGYTTTASDAAVTSASTATAGSGAEQREKSPAVVAVGRELDAALRTRV
jgi:hypothetical protein